AKRGLVRERTVTECREALATVDRLATRALAERGGPWCYGADDLYLQAGEPLPEAGWYGDFEPRENGVGAVRFLQTRIAAALDRLPDLSGQRIGVVTGTAMGPLMPQVLAEAATATGGRFDLVVVENTLFGQSVTTAGLLPAAAIERALAGRTDLDFVLLPGSGGGREEGHPHRRDHRPAQRRQIDVVQPAHRRPGCDRGRPSGNHARSAFWRGRVERTTVLAGGHGRDGAGRARPAQPRHPD